MMTDTLRVLYVDDDSILLKTGKFYLERKGEFTVDTLTSANEAFTRINTVRYNAIISDYQMPGMDGIDFLKKIRASGNTIPFILFTGKGREEVVINALHEGADFYHQKGGEPEALFAELAHKIKAAASSKRADDLLRKSEEKYRHLIEHSNEAIVVAQDGMLKLVNHKTIEFTGYSEQELLSMQFSAFIHPDDRAMVVERYQKRMMGEEGPSRYAFRLSSKDGSTRWVELSVVVIDWDGRPATLNFLTDITERKRAEEALLKNTEELHASYEELTATDDELRHALNVLAENEKLYRNLFHEMLNGFAVQEIICDENGTPKDYRFIDVNPAFTRMTGLNRENLIGKTVLELLPNTEPIWIERCGRVALTGTTDHFENYSQELKKFYEVTVYQNAPHQFTTFISDVTDRKTSEENLFKTMEYLNNLFDYANAPIIVWDPNFVITRFNHAFENLTLISAQEIIGQRLDILFPKESRDTSLLQIKKTLEGERWETVEIPILIKDGSVRTVLWNSANVLDTNGRIISTIAQGVDITERKRLEEALLKKNEELHATNEQLAAAEEELKGQFDALAMSERLIRENEEQVRKKLDSLLSPEGDIGTLDLADIIDVQEIQSMMDDFHALTHIGIAILDINGKILVATGWQDICTKFHRVNPETCANCAESDTLLSCGVEPGTVKRYRCKNNMWDLVTPIVIGGSHAGNLFLGQFLFEDESVDYELFRSQAARYEFDESSYLAALERVPRWNRETVDTVMAFYAKFARMVSTLSHSNITLVRTVTERDTTLNSLQRVNLKLNVLSQLTRQDLTTQIFVLNSYLEMAKKMAKGQDGIIKNIESGERVVRSIKEITEFTKDYQNMGEKLPKWQNVKLAVLFGLSHISIGEIRHSLETENLEIFADPLLEKAFQGLLENSIEHGGHVSFIRVLHTVTPDGVTVVFEDNGIGISAEKKERIFLRGEGVRASVRGLFFVHEILSITGITIRETGEPGKGARFEITVPKGAWRTTGTTDGHQIIQESK